MAHAETEKRQKDTLFHLAKVEKSRNNAKSTLARFEKQAEEARASQKKVESQLALAMVKAKQQQKQLEAKDAERAKAKQDAYDAGMTKIAQSLTAQLWDVVRAFCLEVWGEALNVAGVSAESELRAPDKVYYPLALCFAPSFPQPPVNPNPTSTSA